MDLNSRGQILALLLFCLPLFYPTHGSIDGTPDEEIDRVSVSTVALCTLAMAAATGLGAVPFFFIDLDPEWSGICNGIAAGVMLAASFDLVHEGEEHGSVVPGILSGALFIWLCKKCLERHNDLSMLDLKGADAAKTVLVVGIMTLHSFGEGSGVGVSFAGSNGLSQGLLITLAIAVHNIPEGLAVGMVLASRGVSPRAALLWSVITSLPQPIVAVPSFVFAGTFNGILPFCSGFAAGCMIWIVVAEVLPDGFKEAPASRVATAATASVAMMKFVGELFRAPGFLVPILFGVGPVTGGSVLAAAASVLRCRHDFLTGVSVGTASVLGAWRPARLLLSSSMSVLALAALLGAGAVSVHAVTRCLLARAVRRKSSAVSLAPTAGLSMSALTLRSFASCFAVGAHAAVEGLAVGVASRAAFGPGRHVLLPVALHGLPRGIAVASCVFGATDSWRAGFSSSVAVGAVGPLFAVAAMVAGIDYTGLDHAMVFACGALIPNFWSLGNRAFKVNASMTCSGILIGAASAAACLTCTKLVCLHTPYCNSAPEAVR